ncbi:hypothetical protein GCM10022243_22120 [Saccharothrix violaceirubra]|uniref:PAS domain-containing protein n=1 Tax=Saccharothrix violaceirubra TaxID=413306 RepID=A0A7W7T1I7_9PSEU|nr:NB-ARC domain-containing protein [Saccharothrix violaceirubra]MBB4964852.1 PAS domain-containing protein [Saccharothrix violaceirubra]
MPRRLPPPPALFTARRHELARLDAWLATDRTPLVVLTGPGGIGKSALAAQWLDGVRDRFPDAALHTDLGDPASDPVEDFLRASGVPAHRMPDDPVLLYRALVARRRVAVLLDDAKSAEQVRPLLPDAGVAVVTSRSPLGLDGARVVEVPPLGPDSSLELLERLVGSRVVAERPAAEELVRRCGGSPLALGIVGARLAAGSARTLAAELCALRAEGVAVDPTDAGTTEPLFDLVRSGLPARHARALRLCALLPGPSFDAVGAAVATGEPECRVAALLADLTEWNLLTDAPDGRHRYHALVRAQARQVRVAEHEAARRRIAEWYVVLGRSAPAGELRAAARMAIRSGWPDLVWRLGEALAGRCRADARVPVLEAAADAARRADDRAAQARLTVALADARTRSGRFAAAVRAATEAVLLADRAGDTVTVARAMRRVGRIAVAARRASGHPPVG